jgi:hypothetical protein
MKKYLCLLPLLLFGVAMPASRPSSYPYISGDTFRSYCDYAYDELDRSLNPASILPGSTIFLKTDYLDQFCLKIRPRIRVPYILVTHNSDDAAPGGYTALLDDPHLIAWFGQNHDGYDHPKMHPIPIGLANGHWTHGNSRLLRLVQQSAPPKRYLAYMNFAPATFLSERRLVFSLFANVPFCYQTSAKPFDHYLRELAAADFSISPRGNGVDTHRLWESLYLNTIPIVHSSSLDSLYGDLPVLIVDDWTMVTEEFLTQKKELFAQQNFDREKLYIDYWIDLINASKAFKSNVENSPR